ncbi:MAG: ORF6N domain-containing protein [Bacteroidetes bacterium]|nr:ORF6N domain-containing protein [Bacteroidota bacterium]
MSSATTYYFMEMTKEVNVKIPDEAIINKIIVIRDYKVMIDKDLAELYGITTKRLNDKSIEI